MNGSRYVKILTMLATVLIMAFSMIMGVSCDRDNGSGDKLAIVVTILPQAEFVEKVGGEKVEITVMVPEGHSPHTYEPSPGQMKELSQADLYAKVGSGIEFELVWMDNFIDLNRDMLILDSSEGIELKSMASSDTGIYNGSDNSKNDPHIWMSPKNAVVMAENIANGLIELDPSNRDYYQGNLQEYTTALEEIDASIRDGLSDVENRIFMVYHPSFGYFARDYNLTMLTVEDEGKEPTPAGIAHLIEQANEYDIKAVFASPQFNPDSAEVIADEIEGKVIFIDPLTRDYRDNLSVLRDHLVQYME